MIARTTKTGLTSVRAISHVCAGTLKILKSRFPWEFVRIGNNHVAALSAWSFTNFVCTRPDAAQKT
jgi:hypothetical protein